MANPQVTVDPLDELRLMAPDVPDRLPAMLFLAALIHGILIIGVTFNAAITDDFANAISLDVTIVADPDQQIDTPDEAAYLAQASQEGGGNTEDRVRPAAPLQSALPVDNQGREDGTALRDSVAHERSADEVLASENSSDRQAVIDPRTDPQQRDSVAIAMEAGAEVTLPLPQEADANMLISDNQPKDLIISADTRESVAAAYLDSWKRRVEAVGTAYLKELGDIGAATRSPTLMVVIDPSGNLVDAMIRRSSGSTVHDLATLDILKRSSPFNAFPPEMLEEYETGVRFEYDWRFSDQLVTSNSANE